MIRWMELAVLDRCVAVIGLGYVGLPLVLEFGKHMKTIGFDIVPEKVAKCQAGKDPSNEIPDHELALAKHAEYTTNGYRLMEADYLIVAVPTPVDEANVPDFGPLLAASKTVAAYIKVGGTVIFESTVYPGATEEICIPQIEKSSGLKWKKDFFVGYSPERINPGDREHGLTKVIKVVSGDTDETLEKVAALYELIIQPGVHRASSIKVAEAAKVIENTQRDVNIALMNELAQIFNRIGIDTMEVLQAAGSKWNFLPFTPGLVGGHCIGVDPYYLTHKAEMVGYHADLILAGRRTNDSMAKFIAENTVKQLIKSGSSLQGATVNVLGITFKENCGDIRNSKVIDIINELKSYGLTVVVHDPLADPDEIMHEYGVQLCSWADLQPANAVVAAVAHQFYKEEDLIQLVQEPGCFIDVKSAFTENSEPDCGILIWRL